MKKLIITHFLINLYLIALIAPAIPILEYWLNYDYIANELCVNKDKPLLSCNGMCYVQDQVEKQQNRNSDSETPQPPKVDFEKFITLKTKKFDYSFIDTENFTQCPEAYFEMDGLLSVTSLLKPPRA